MLVLVATAMLLAGLPGIYFAHKKAQRDAIRQMQQDARMAVKDFEKETDDIKEVSRALEAAFRSTFDAEKHFRKKADLDQFKEGFINQVTEILHLMRPMSLWIVFNTENIEGKHTISLYDKEGRGVYTKAPEYRVTEKDLSQVSMQWWKNAVENIETWTKPYFWRAWDMKVISYSKAIYINSQLIGCLGSDFNFKTLITRLDTLHHFKTGHLILLDNKNDLIYSSNSKYAYTPDNAGVIEKIIDSDTDFFYTDLKNGRNVVARENIDNGWTLALIVSEKEIFSQVNQLIYTLLIIFISVFLVAIILAFYFSNYITSPVKRLLAKFRYATNGDLSVRADIRTNDEMKEIAEHFNQMMDSLQKSFGELEIAQKKLSREKERAQESDSLKSSFLENLSHEVRTPLMAIVGFSELMTDPVSTADERQEFFSHIASNSNLLVRFIEDTLLFSQLEKGQAHVKKSRFKAKEILEQLKEEFELRREKEKPHLYFRVLSDGCEIILYSDPHLLKKLIRYLLDNAFKFTDSGGVTLICRRTDYHYEISISDSGIGISDDKTELVFRKFCKAIESPDRVYDGAGIGLTNARGLVILLNGTIELSSTRGEGTTVTLSFPIHEQ